MDLKSHVKFSIAQFWAAQPLCCLCPLTQVRFWSPLPGPPAVMTGIGGMHTPWDNSAFSGLDKHWAVHRLCGMHWSEFPPPCFCKKKVVQIQLWNNHGWTTSSQIPPHPLNVYWRVHNNKTVAAPKETILVAALNCKADTSTQKVGSKDQCQQQELILRLTWYNCLFGEVTFWHEHIAEFLAALGKVHIFESIEK